MSRRRVMSPGVELHSERLGPDRTKQLRYDSLDGEYALLSFPANGLSMLDMMPADNCGIKTPFRKAVLLVDDHSNHRL